MLVSALALSSGYLNVAAPGSRLAQSRVSSVNMDLQAAFPEATAGATGAQDFLEAEPYWDQSTVPVNTYKNKAPFVGKIMSVKRIVGPTATGETTHIIMNHEGKMPYWEGQSYGVIPPGENPKKPGKPNTVRLYSIASSRYGDDMTGTTTSLCVRRATYWCPELKADDPAKKGICSNFLCDSTPGTELALTGPSGKVMLMPEEKKDTDLIMVATGTGIAPYRSFLRRLFVEKTPFAADYKGIAWLFLGVANSDALLYDDEWQAIKEAYPNNFRLDYALARADEQGRRQDVHPGQGRGVLGGDLHSDGQRRAHVLLRPQGHDAGHHRHARERLQVEEHRLRGEAQGVEEGRPVARRGLLNAFYGRGEWRAPALYCQRAHAAARAVRGALAGPGGFC